MWCWANTGPALATPCPPSVQCQLWPWMRFKRTLNACCCSFCQLYDQIILYVPVAIFWVNKYAYDSRYPVYLRASLGDPHQKQVYHLMSSVLKDKIDTAKIKTTRGQISIRNNGIWLTKNIDDINILFILNGFKRNYDISVTGMTSYSHLKRWSTIYRSIFGFDANLLR